MYTTKQYAEIYNVSQRTVQRWIQNGNIFAVQVGNKYLIPDDEVPVQFIEQEPPQTAPIQPVETLTEQEFAAEYNLTPEQVAQAIYEGKVDVEKDGNRTVITVYSESDLSSFEPEEPDFDDEDDNGFPITDETNIPREDLRQEFATLAEAESYIEPIPIDRLDVTIIKNERGLFRVLVHYEVIVDVETEELEEA